MTLSQDAIALAEHAHDMAMSRDPFVAAEGRLLKEVMPAFARWANAEACRGHNVEASAALASFISRIICAWSANVSKPGTSSAVASAIADSIVKEIEDLAEAGMDAAFDAIKSGDIVP